MGIEVIKNARQMNFHLEIIIISGYGLMPKAAIVHGVSGYLLKPIKRVELEEALEQTKRSIEKRENDRR